MLTDEQILEIAHNSGSNPTQRNACAGAIRATLAQLADVAQRQGQAPDVTHGEAIPAAPVVICVGSSTTVTVAQERELWARLDKAHGLFGKVEIVTFGGRGNEVNAHKWAKARGMSVREFAVAWTVVKADGSTRRDGNALSVRDRKLKAYLGKAEQVFTLAYVDPDDRSAKRIAAMDAQILRWHPLRTPAPPSVPADTRTIDEMAADQAAAEEAIA